MGLIPSLNVCSAGAQRVLLTESHLLSVIALV